MYRSAAVSVWAPMLSKDSSGLITKTWSYPSGTPLASFTCDVQPARLNSYQKELWGLSDLSANAKHMIMDFSLKAYWSSCAAPNRVTYGSSVFDIVATNTWSRSCELLLEPVQGE